jgi:hypothetical protein
MLPFRTHKKEKHHKDLDEQTPLLVTQKEPLLTELALEQQCKQHFLTVMACLSFVCSLLSLIMMIVTTKHVKSQQQQQQHDDANYSWQTSFPAATTHSYSHWSTWMSALTSCLIVSPLLGVMQSKLVQLEAWRVSTQVWTDEINQLNQENQLLHKQVQSHQGCITPYVLLYTIFCIV